MGEALWFNVSKSWTLTAKCDTLCDVVVLNRKLIYNKSFEIDPKHASEVQILFDLFHGQSEVSEAWNKKKMFFDCSLFKGCSEAFVARLAKHLEERVYLPQQTIVQVGAEEDSLYFLNQYVQGHEGREEIYEGRRSSALITVKASALKRKSRSGKSSQTPGSVFGVLQFLGLKSKHYSTLTAGSICPVQVLHRKVFLSALDDFPCEPGSTEMRHLLEDDLQHIGFDPSHLDPMKSEALASLPLLRNCSEAFVNAVKSAFGRRIHPPGQQVVRAGDKISDLVVVNRGTASALVQGVGIRKLEKGDFFGDLALLGASKRAAITVKCETTIELWVLSSTVFSEILTDFPTEEAKFVEISEYSMPSIVSDAQVRPRADTELRQRRRLSQAKNADARQLSHLDFFGGCATQFLEEVQRSMEERIFFAGEEILTLGDQGDCMIILHKGTVDVEIGEEVLSELTEGSVFGEMGLLGLQERRTTTMRAKDLCACHVLHRSVFDALVKRYPKEKPRFERIALARLEQSGSFKLNHATFFSKSDPKFLELLAPYIETQLHPPGSTISTDGMWVLSLGEAYEERGGHVMRELVAGDAFGEAVVLGITKKIESTVRTRSLCVVRQMNSTIFLKTVAGFPIEAQRFVQQANRNIGQGESVVSPLFRGVNPRFLENVTNALRWHTFLPGNHIIKEGFIGTAVYMLDHGTVAVEFGGQLVPGMVLGPGDCMGQMNVLGLDKKYRCGLRTESVCHLRSLTAEVLESMLSAFPGERARFEELAIETRQEESQRFQLMRELVAKANVKRRMDSAFSAHVGVVKLREEIKEEQNAAYEMAATGNGSRPTTSNSSSQVSLSGAEAGGASGDNLKGRKSMAGQALSDSRGQLKRGTIAAKKTFKVN